MWYGAGEKSEAGGAILEKKDIIGSVAWGS